MTFFDASNWRHYKWHYVVILVIIIAIIIYIYMTQEKELRGGGHRKRGDGNGDIYYLGRGNNNDPPNVLIDRIDWAAYLEKRVTLWQRIFVGTLAAMFFVILLGMRKLPTPGTIVIIFISIFIPIYAVHQLFYVHGDVYNDFYIRTNAQLLRDEFGFDKNFPPEPIDNIPDRPYVMNKKTTNS